MNEKTSLSTEAARRQQPAAALMKGKIMDEFVESTMMPQFRDLIDDILDLDQRDWFS